MGKRGPKPTPTASLKIRGSWLAGTREGEPVLSVDEVPCPSWVRASAREHWPELCETLKGMGLLSRPFSIAMGQLVNQLDAYLRFEGEIDETTESIVNGMANPIFGLRDKAWDRLVKICNEFGLTPSSLTGVRSVKGDEKPQGIGRFKLSRG